MWRQHCRAKLTAEPSVFPTKYAEILLAYPFVVFSGMVKFNQDNFGQDPERFVFNRTQVEPVHRQVYWPNPIGSLLSELRLPEKIVDGDSLSEKQYQERQAIAKQNRNETAKLVEQAIVKIETELKQKKSETLNRFLKTISTFQSFSFDNQFLILAQHPDATRLAGLDEWKELGRFVKSGETGIGILKPIFFRSKISECPRKAESEKRSLGQQHGFLLVSVFDLAQTDGKPLPEVSQSMEGPDIYLSKLKRLVASRGVKVEFKNLNDSIGQFEDGKILIDSNLDQAERFSALAHGFTRELIHRRSRRITTSALSREIECAAVANIACNAFGINDTLFESWDYSQIYQGDSESLVLSLRDIRRAAMEIIWGLNAKWS